MSVAYVGRTYPPTEPYDVSRAKIREFATAIGSTNPLHYDVDAARRAGFTDLLAPPTFPSLLTIEAGHQVLHDPAFGFDLGRSLHGTQEFSYRRPIVAGDCLQVIISVADVTRRLTNESATIRGDIVSRAGEPVATSICVVVVRTGPQP
jgi:acyl dehydratase